MSDSSPPLPAAAPSRTALVLAFAAIYVIWGSTYLGIRVAVETMPPFTMAGVRFVLAGGLLFAFLRWRGAAWPTARQWWSNAIIGAFLLLGGNGCVAWAEQFVPSGVTALLIGVQPLFFVLTEWAWPGGTRPTAAIMAALLLGFAGVAWLAAPWQSVREGGIDLAGVLAVLGACVSWAIGSIYSRHARHGAEPLLASSLQMLTGGATLLLVAALHGDLAQFHPAAVSTRSWAALAYLIGCGSLVGFSTFVWLIKHSTPARVSTYAYVNPIVAVFLGWLILDEPVTGRTLAASAVIIAAVVMITLQKSRSAR
jgi:drug/metabolite transporter (DMT)-like permease